MNPQKDDKITRQAQEQHAMEGDNQWILGSPTTTLKTGSQSASTATNTDIWQKNAEQRRRNGIHEPVSNATRKGILPRTAKESR